MQLLKSYPDKLIFSGGIMVEKIINLSREDFSEEQWDIICSEFDVDSNTESITAVIDASSVSDC